MTHYRLQTSKAASCLLALMLVACTSEEPQSTDLNVGVEAEDALNAAMEGEPAETHEGVDINDVGE